LCSVTTNGLDAGVVLSSKVWVIPAYTLSKQHVLVVDGLYLLFRPLRDLGGSPVTGQRGPTDLTLRLDLTLRQGNGSWKPWDCQLAGRRCQRDIYDR
jgi:hypothetical protein